MLATDLSPIDLFRRDGCIKLHKPLTLVSGTNDVIASWREYCSLPLGDKQSMPYEADPQQGVSGSGYLASWLGGDDPKEQFHFKLRDYKRLRANVKAVGSREGEQLVEHCMALLDRATPLVRDFSERMECDFGLSCFWRSVMRGRDTWVLRLLHYLPTNAIGSVSGLPHADRGGFTLKIYESAPGLERFSNDGCWMPFPVHADEVPVIPGLRMQYLSACALTATLHRIVVTPEAIVGRFSSVFFIEFDDSVPFFNKGKHGSQQKLPGGYNLSMPFEEFRQYFE